MEIKVVKDILDANEQLGHRNRKLFDCNKLFTVNLMSSPGAGKTSLILQTIKGLKGKVKIGVIEGDVSSSLDAEVVAREGVPVVQINTGNGCHLDADMIQRAVRKLEIKDHATLFIENVGNLVCPALFDLLKLFRVVRSTRQLLPYRYRRMVGASGPRRYSASD